jgi:hypothetical protein
MKTAKELLNPRFEVIADYPNNHSLIGEILECPDLDDYLTKKHVIQHVW